MDTPLDEIGVVFGLPGCAERLAADLLRTPEDHDYGWAMVKHHCRDSLYGVSAPSQIIDPDAVAQATWAANSIAPYLKAYARLLEAAKTCGVAFANELAPDRASLADFALMLRRRRYVVVISHWRDAYVATHHWQNPSDLKTLCTRVKLLADNVAQLTDTTDELIEALRTVADDPNPISAITRAVNALISSDLCLFAPTDDEYAASSVLGSAPFIDPINRQARNRDEIDLFFGLDLLSPGNRLELGSGFVTMNALDATIDDRPGAILFVACFSQVIQNRLSPRNHRRTWGRSEALSPSGWIYALAYAFEEIKSQGGNLMAVLDRIASDVDFEARLLSS